MKHTIAVIFFLTTIIGHINAQAPKYSNEFLAIGVGSQALGLGKAVSATTNDVTAGYWNPAGLAHIENNIQAAFKIGRASCRERV